MPFPYEFPIAFEPEAAPVYPGGAITAVEEVSCLGIGCCLGEECIPGVYGGTIPVSTILTDLLAYQKNANPIQAGSVDAGLDKEYNAKFEWQSLLQAVYATRDFAGGFATIDIDPINPAIRSLSLKSSIGEDKGQQIRYRKNIKGLTRDIDYAEQRLKLYPLGFGEGGEHLQLNILQIVKEIASKSSDASYGYLKLGGQYSCYKGWIALGDNLPPEMIVYKDDVDNSSVWKQGSDERTLRCAIADFDPAAIYKVTYWHASFIKAWDVIVNGNISSAPWTNKDIADLNTLLSAARLALDELKLPRTEYNAEIINLAEGEDWVGFEFDKLQLGSIVKVIDEDLGIDVLCQIVGLTYNDLAYPEDIGIELSNKTSSLDSQFRDIGHILGQYQLSTGTRLRADKVVLQQASAPVLLDTWIYPGTDEIDPDRIHGYIPGGGGGGSGKSQYARVLTVGEGDFDYSRLSYALDSITDASASKRYAIWVFGKVYDVPNMPIGNEYRIIAKSYVDIIGFDADIDITSDFKGHGISFNGISEANWRNITLRRKGTPPSSSHVITVYGATADSLRFLGCRFINEISGVDYCCGVDVRNTAKPVFQSCYAKGGDSIRGRAWNVGNESSPSLMSCRGKGGNGDNSRGIVVWADAYPTIIGGEFEGGTGEMCHGMTNNDRTKARIVGVRCKGGIGDNNHGCCFWGAAMSVLSDCIGEGGSGTNCRGFTVGNSASPKMTGCIGIGGDGGTECHGLSIGNAASPDISGGTYSPGSGGEDCCGMTLWSNCTPKITGVSVVPKRLSYWYENDDAQKFRPFTGKPYQLVSIAVRVVTTAPAGTTLSLGTTLGGSEIASGIPLDVVDPEEEGDFWKFFLFERPELIADSYIYATPSVAVPDDYFRVYYDVITNYANCYALWLSSKGYPKVFSSNFMSNGASDVVYIAMDGMNGRWEFYRCHFETYDPVNQKALKAYAALSDAKFYDCSFVGGFTNITSFDMLPVRGSLIPDATQAYDLGSETKRWRYGYFETMGIGDQVFSNGWRLTEAEKYDMGEGLLLISPDGRKYKFKLEEVS